MGRHANADAAADDTAIDPDGAERDMPTARHAVHGSRAAGQLLENNAVISPDTHVGVDFNELVPGTQDATPSPANPDALVERGLVGDGHEME